MVKIKNFIADYEEYLSDSESPKLFRTWGAIACIAGALERRVWVQNRKMSISGRIYPTQGIFHIAPTGVGKAPSVKLCQHLWDSVGHLKIGTESMTAAAFYDELLESRTLTYDNDFQHCMAIATEEISSFFIQYDHQMLGVMLKALDCSKKIDQRRRTLKDRLIIQNPALTCLFAGQPSQFNDKFPEAAYGLGFMGRCHIVYSEDAITVPFFNEGNNINPRLLESLEDQIDQIADMNGELAFTSDAKPFMEEQQRKKKEITPPHPRLEGYYERRPVHMVKVAMIKAISMGRTQIHLCDLEWALRLMEQTEINAPKAFQVFKQDDDSLIIDTFLREMKEKGKYKILTRDLWRWLDKRVQHIQVPILIQSLTKGEYIKLNTSGTHYIISGVTPPGDEPHEKITKIK